MRGKSKFEKIVYFPFFIYILKSRLFMSSKLEKEFQADLIKELKSRFSGCIVMKNDSSYIQGIPDLLILY